MIQFDEHKFQMDWFNRQLAHTWAYLQGPKDVLMSNVKIVIFESSKKK